MVFGFWERLSIGNLPNRKEMFVTILKYAVDCLVDRSRRNRASSLHICQGGRGNARSRILFFLLFVGVVGWGGIGQAATVKDASLQEIRTFFRDTKKTVLTFLGYSGAGYENQAAMLQQAEQVLSSYDPQKTIVNIGATPEGIGAVYELAKRKGFVTTGIVSSRAKQYNVQLSAHVDHVFYVEDATWGGFLKGTQKLSPTSAAMVENSDTVIAIGGGEIARDELLAARRSKKQVHFIPADMNHQKARETARKRGLPQPDFRGAAHGAL
jgi:hypothetical protein